MRGSSVFLALFVAACAPPAAPPAVSIDVASAPGETAAGDPDACTAEIATERFTAANGGKPPAGWTAAGRLNIVMKQGKPVSLQVLDTANTVVRQDPAPADAREARAAMRAAACRIGGVLVMPPGKPQRNTAVMKLLVIRPAAPDEAGDVAMLCAVPDPTLEGGSYDPSQRVTIAAQLYGERLTSPKWRGWLVGMGRELEGARDPAAVRRARAAELRAAGREPCWFAAALTGE